MIVFELPNNIESLFLKVVISYWILII